MKNTDLLCERTGYGFKDPELLKEALTHSSCGIFDGEGIPFNNERLEFLGDAFLDAVVGKMLFDMLPGAPEGDLSRRRAQIVCERELASVSRKLGLGECLLLGRGEENQGGRNKDSILADALEALIGAVVLDGGYASAEALIKRLFSGIITMPPDEMLFKDYKSLLQEKIQKMDSSILPIYTVIDESGPDHDKTFRVRTEARGKILGEGTGKSKKEAEQNAARDSLRKGIDNVF